MPGMGRDMSAEDASEEVQRERRFGRIEGQLAQLIRELENSERDSKQYRHDSANMHQTIYNNLHDLNTEVAKLSLTINGDGKEAGGLTGDVRELRDAMLKSRGGWVVIAAGVSALGLIFTGAAWFTNFFGIHIGKTP